MRRPGYEKGAVKNFIFISRHEPNADQHTLAGDQGVRLIHVGDVDAFAPDLRAQVADLLAQHDAQGVVAVHPLVALAATANGAAFGSFRNVNRAPVGAPPQFGTDLFVVVP